MRNGMPCFIGLIFLGLSATTACGQGFHQTEFVISFWVDPKMDEQADLRYKEIADANFSLVMGGFGASTPEQIRRQIALCEKYGMKVIVDSHAFPLDQLPAHAACLGYRLRDEPGANEFQSLCEEAAVIRKARPGKLVFINLFPIYASPAKDLQSKDYGDYVSQYMRIVQPELLCTDYYPNFRSDDKGDPRSGYRQNLAVLKNAAEKDGLPFWIYFDAMAFGSYGDPSEAQLRWQAYTAVAYGVKGVLYFCYQSPWWGDDLFFAKDGALIDRNGRKTRHYEQAKRINGELKTLGPTLMKLSPVRTLHLEGARSYDAQALAGSPLATISAPLKDDPALNLELGVLKHADGRNSLILVNNDFTYTAWATVLFSVPQEKVVEIDKQTGKEIPVYDESPKIPGLQLSFDCAEGRVFLY